VIAEGVEDKDTWNKLESMGCDMIQGYYISRPLPADEFEGWLAESEWKCKAPYEKPPLI
jgi:EAL domain-containing protein (putative c-di-GMP-specific phosphodiesterase class I)